MNFMKFHNFRKKRTFCPKVHFGHFGPPKSINIPGAMEGFPPRAGNVCFPGKVALCAHCRTFHEKSIFMIFMIFMKKHDFSNYAR